MLAHYGSTYKEAGEAQRHTADERRWARMNPPEAGERRWQEQAPAQRDWAGRVSALPRRLTDAPAGVRPVLPRAAQRVEGFHQGADAEHGRGAPE